MFHWHCPPMWKLELQAGVVAQANQYRPQALSLLTAAGGGNQPHPASDKNRLPVWLSNNGTRAVRWGSEAGSEDLQRSATHAVSLL